MKYGVFAKGGSIGTKNDKPWYVYDTKEEAKTTAARLRKRLTPGERSYYGMGYVVKEVK